MKIFHFLIIFSVFTFLSKTQEDEYIYSQFYRSKYDFQQNEGNSLQIKVAFNANLLFVATGFGGVMILDSTSGKKIFQKSINSQSIVNSIECSGDGQYFIVGIQPNLVRGYQFSIEQHQISQLFEAQMSESIVDMVKDNNEQILYLAGALGKIMVIDFTKKNVLAILAEYTPNVLNEINSIFISKFNSYIFTAANYGRAQVFKYDQNQKKVIFVASGLTNYQASASIGTKDDKYIYAIDNWSGLFVADMSIISTTDPSLYPVQLSMQAVWPFVDKDPNCFSLALSQEENLVFVGVRSQGILVFNIKDKLNPIFFYQIQVITLSYYITFSKDYRLMYYANYQSIFIFELTELNLNDNLPNIFNSHQIVEKENDSSYKWRCNLVDNDKYFFGSFDIDGLFIYQYNNNPYQLDLKKAKHYDIYSESLALYKGSTIFYTPRLGDQNILFLAYDYSTLNDPIIQDITLKETFYQLPGNHNSAVEYMIFNKDQTLCVVTQLQGFILLQFDGPLKITALATYLKPTHEQSVLPTGAVISKDNKYILISFRQFGLSLVEISQDYQMQEKSYLQTLGGESLRYSDVSDDYCFLLDGSNGFAIIDMTAFPKIKFLSQIKLIGWSNFIIPLYNDNYAFVQQRENGMISIIDIRDKTNISLFSTYQRGQDQATTACVSLEQDYSFVTNKKYVLVVPLKSQVKLHAQAQEIIGENNNYVVIKNIQKDEILEVGQIIQYNFLILYPKSEKQKIYQIKVYDQFQEKSLPFWMNYDSVSHTLTINVDKSGVGVNLREANQIILLVYTVNPLDKNSFYFKSGQGTTSPEQSTQIFNYLKEKNMIDSQNQMTQLFDPNSNLTINIAGIDDNIINNVKQAMLQSIWVNQVAIKVQSSLSFDQKASQIVTRSKQVSVLLSITEDSGQFVTKDYPGAIISYSTKKNSLKLEGSLLEINQIIQNKILLFINSSSYNELISISIQDNINYPLQSTQILQSCKFIVFKLQIEVSKDNNLQSQINSKFSNSQIYIETDYSLSFQQSTFQVSDVNTITYKFQVKVNEQNEFSDINPSFWLQPQSDKSLFMYGSPKYEQLNDIIVVKVTASDGYTIVSDEFTLKVTGIPFFYVFNILLRVIGPLFALLGLYRYRSKLINRLFAKKFTFSSETALSDKKYQKKIPLLGTNWKFCTILIDGLFDILLEKRGGKLKNKLDKMSYKNMAYKFTKNQQTNLQRFNRIQQSQRNSYFEKRYLTSQGDVNTFKIIEDILINKTILVQRNKQLASIERQLSSQSLPGALLYESIKSYCSYLFLQRDAKSNFLFQNIKQYLIDQEMHTRNDWYLQIININHQFSEEHSHSPFPQININQLEFTKVLNQLLIQKENLDPQQSGLNKLECENGNFIQPINFVLIENCIISEAMGLTFNTLGTFQYYSGESIHLKSHQIVKIEAFKRAPQGILFQIRQMFGIEFIPYGVSKNMKLPDWLHLKFQHGYLKLLGTPSTEEEDHTLIRIYNSSGYIIKQFIIDVLPNISNTIINIPEEKNLIESERQNMVAKEDFNVLFLKNKFNLFNSIQTDRIISISTPKILSQEQLFPKK